MFIIPEDFKTRYDIGLISSGFLGIHTMTGEITGRTPETLVLAGELPVVINRGEYSFMWAFVKKSYPKLIKKLVSLHKDVEREFGELLSKWTGVEEEVIEVKTYIMERLGEITIPQKLEETIEEEFEREFGEALGKE